MKPVQDFLAVKDQSKPMVGWHSQSQLSDEGST